jgi:hypothetical protein
VLNKTVNRRLPNDRFVIALHSLGGVAETGLRMCLPEKSQDSDRIRCRGVRSLQSGFRGIIAKYGHSLGILEEEEPTFFTVQTAWRREWDSITTFFRNYR